MRNYLFRKKKKEFAWPSFESEVKDMSAEGGLENMKTLVLSRKFCWIYLGNEFKNLFYSPASAKSLKFQQKCKQILRTKAQIPGKW